MLFPVDRVNIQDLFDWSKENTKEESSAHRKQHNNNNKLVEVNGIKIALFRYGEKVFAVNDKCPHLGGPLHLGDIEELPHGVLCIKCPWHRWRIKLSNGQVIYRKDKTAMVYPVKIDEEGNISIEFQSINAKYFASDDF